MQYAGVAAAFASDVHEDAQQSMSGLVSLALFGHATVTGQPTPRMARRAASVHGTEPGQPLSLHALHVSSACDSEPLLGGTQTFVPPHATAVDHVLSAAHVCTA